MEWVDRGRLLLPFIFPFPFECAEHIHIPAATTAIDVILSSTVISRTTTCIGITIAVITVVAMTGINYIGISTLPKGTITGLVASVCVIVALLLTGASLLLFGGGGIALLTGWPPLGLASLLFYSTRNGRFIYLISIFYLSDLVP